jgi:hypothetical protein
MIFSRSKKATDVMRKRREAPNNRCPSVGKEKKRAVILDAARINDVAPQICI